MRSAKIWTGLVFLLVFMGMACTAVYACYLPYTLPSARMYVNSVEVLQGGTVTVCKDSPITFRAEAEDWDLVYGCPVRDEVDYLRWDFGDGIDFVCPCSGGCQETCETTHTYTECGEFIVLLFLEDVPYLADDMSYPRFFYVQVDCGEPDPGTASSPAYADASPTVVTYSGATDYVTGIGIEKVELWFKKGSGGTWTDSGLSSTQSSGSFNFTGMTGDDTYYFDLVAEDKCGNRSDEASGDGDCSTIYDTSPPSTPVITDDGEYTIIATELHASWASTDPESGVAEFQYAIGTSPTDPGSDYVVGWTTSGSNTEVTHQSLTLTDGVTYYFYVKAKNCVGIWSDIGVSNGIVVLLPHDAEDEFSILNNPSGDWSYGHVPNLSPGYSMTLYEENTTHTEAPLTGLERWHESTLALEPSVTHNPTEQAISDGNHTTWPGHCLALHPGPQGSKSIVRYTASEAGTYLVSGRFSDIAGRHTSTDVHIMHNGVSIFEGQISNLYEGQEPRIARPSQVFFRDIELQIGDRVDFAVGCGTDSDCSSDATRLEASFSPSTLPIFYNTAASPCVANVGDVVTITFTVSEQLSGTPTVTVNGHSTTTPTNQGLDYTCQYTIQSSDPAGDATIEITGVDLDGNQGSATNTDALTVATVPVVTAPIGTTGDLVPLVTWTASGTCDRYQVQLVNVADQEDAWDSGEVISTDSSAQVTRLLINNATYWVKVRIGKFCGWGEWSQPAEFTVIFTEPLLPTVVPYCSQ